MRDRETVKRVLIYRLGSLGDTIVALPSLHLIARTFPNAERKLLTNFPAHSKASAAASVLGESGLVHGYLHYPIGTRNVFKLAGLCRQIRKFRPQVLVYLAAARGDRAVRRDEIFFRMCGIREIVGLPRGDSAKPLFNPQTGIWELESARLLRMVQSLGDSTIEDRDNWNLSPTPAEENAGDAALAPVAGWPLIVCGPGTKMQAKDWGQENWRLLFKRLSEELPGHALALIGAKEEASMSDYAAEGWRGPVVNLCGQLTPRETAAVLRKAELFLGPDSGPMHLAAAAGVPCVIAFAARTKPGIWFPVGQQNRIIYHSVDCMGCNIETCIEQKKKCLSSITVDEMLAAALDTYSRKGKGTASQSA